MKLETGTTISHYKILSEIGKGGMGVVYLAQDKKLTRKVALKTLPEPFASDPERMYRFYQEAKAASSLNHPNIITIYEVGEIEDLHYISSEFIKGKALSESLNGRPMKLREVLDIACQIASALDTAHSNGIVHRDIKPQNIMVRPDGLVKVLDFGIAKLTERTPEEVEAEAETVKLMETSEGTIIGTASFMSPEQARGREIDARSDIFSFGIILYEMVSGRLPFRGENKLDIVASILHTEPKPLRHISSNIPPEIETIIDRTLKKDKKDRYQTVKNLLKDLEEVRQDLEFQNKLEKTLSPDSDDALTETVPADRSSESKKAAVGAKNSLAAINKYSPSLLYSLIFILLAGIFSIIYFTFLSGNPTSEPIRSLAILPFSNVGGDSDTEYLSDGLTESIIYNLSNLADLKVLPSSTVFRYKGKETTAQLASEELNVRAVLVSRVVKRNDSLTISTELIDVKENKVLWGERYEREISDVLRLQKEISTEISERLRLKLTGSEEQRVAKDYTKNNKAYQAYLRGRFHWNKRNEKSLKTGIGYFNQAIEMDPNYALAWSGLADSYLLLPEYSSTPQKEAMPKGKAAAEKAIELDPNLAEAHTSLAYVLTSYEWKIAEAEKEFQKALELNPDYTTANQWYGILLEITGRNEEAIKQGEKALRLEPLSQIVNFSTGYRYLNARKYDQAVRQFRRALEIYPNFAPGHRRLGFALARQGKFDAAIIELQKAEKLSGFSTQGAVGYVYALAGKKDEARRILKQELNSPQKDARNIAGIYAELGDKDNAFKWLEVLYKQRDDRILYLKISPFYDSLRDDPRYRDLVRRIGLGG
ncbi:MAG: protein kinase [Pyrinomonadaceae bacterium]|nr:protein kinase [Pyrinomonadaceae bacterium]